MSKELPAQVLAQMDATNKRPVLLFELGLTSPVRFVAYKTNITFPTAGNVYTAKHITVSSVSQTIEGQIGRVTCTFDNVSRDMAAYANAVPFKGKSLTIKRVYLDALGDASYFNEYFNGVMETPSEIGRESLIVSATLGNPLSKKSLSFAYQRQCPWDFGDDDCNTDGLSDLSTLTATGTADSGSTTTLIDNALTQVDDFWNTGQINIVKDGVGYRRKIKDFVAASDTLTFDVELPVAVDNTTTYEIFKGCDNTWDTCQSLNAWGPSADNFLNFGGCLHVANKTDSGT